MLNPSLSHSRPMSHVDVLAGLPFSPKSDSPVPANIYNAHRRIPNF